MNYAKNITKEAVVNEDFFDSEYAGKKGVIVNYDDTDDSYIFYKLLFPDDYLNLHEEWFSEEEISILNQEVSN